ncbi:hypothetical protein [Novosphingobium sp. FKTRR1]|uniref:hypothetical protein n=1 Tax=Novosphingobium sp. FKTRR1 TaxID=2879118 RepID=UPI001CF0A061|nr:hypothetical protein [Novosphingobium sp. FKTRR1]
MCNRFATGKTLKLQDFLRGCSGCALSFRVMRMQASACATMRVYVRVTLQLCNHSGLLIYINGLMVAEAVAHRLRLQPASAGSRLVRISTEIQNILAGGNGGRSLDWAGSSVTRGRVAQTFGDLLALTGARSAAARCRPGEARMADFCGFRRVGWSVLERCRWNVRRKVLQGKGFSVRCICLSG